MSSIAAELRGETVPEFALTLPDGWVRQMPSDEIRDQMLKAAKNRLMQIHRPDLYAQTIPLVKKLFAEMRRVETVAFFAPEAGAPDSSYLPATLTASIRRGQDGASLDGTVAQLIRTEGATALGGDKRILRWQRDSVEVLDSLRVATTTVVYFTPIPGTGRQRALQFTLVITHDTLESGDPEFVTALTDLFDSHLSTFSWMDT